MRVDWKDFLMTYWPFLCLVLVNVVGVIYTCGFESGKRSLIDASLTAQREATGKV